MNEKPYQEVLKLLFKSDESASKCYLKQVIHEQVSSGCPFEKYIGLIFQAMDGETHVKVLSGVNSLSRARVTVCD